MSYSLIVGPVVGALVGYCTNFIAVKMLFWPLKEVRIGKFRVPFTPGVIPKEKNRIIEKVSRTIGNELLSADYIAKEVLNDSVKEKFTKSAIEYKNRAMENEVSLAEILEANIDMEKFNTVSEKGKHMLCKHIYDSIMEKNPSKMIIEKVVEAVKEKLRGGLLSVVITDSFIASMADGFKVKIDKYLDEELYDFLYEQIDQQVDRILAKNPSDILSSTVIEDALVEKLVGIAFDEIVVPEVSKMITSVDIAEIVTNKMEKMDIEELENVLSSILKKELGYVINFGLIIGFIIGLISAIPIL